MHDKDFDLLGKLALKDNLMLLHLVLFKFCGMLILQNPSCTFGCRSEFF